MTVTREEFEDVKVLVGVAARSSETASAAAERASTAVASLSGKLDEYIYQSQRVITQHSERLSRVEGQSERLEAVFAMQQRQMERLERNHDVLQQVMATQQEQLIRQQQQLERMDETQRSTNAALDQLGSILNQLIKRD
jgi:chromosome segregation ATPase